jgi:hypothetical protein
MLPAVDTGGVNHKAWFAALFGDVVVSRWPAGSGADDMEN